MDLLTKARLKITFLYLLLGVVILSIAGYLVYADLTAIIVNTLQVLQGLLRQGTAINQGTAATVMAQNIDAQIRQMDLAVGIWLITAMVLSAYLLASFTLRPVKRAMERQKRFMANISHELRTPLSVMKTSTEAALLGAGQLTRAELIEIKKSNLEEIDRMSKIIEFLMNFSNIENRMSRLAFSAVDLADVAGKAVGMMQQRAEAKGVNLVLRTEPATVSGNATALEEVILNLIKNALTYTAAGGSVVVIVTKRYGSPTASVQDTGAGIAPKDIPNIFEAFYRGVNAAEKKQDGGSGLGLAIVKDIVAFHNATISVRSTLGKGTNITVRFPGRFSRWFTPWL